MDDIDESFYMFKKGSIFGQALVWTKIKQMAETELKKIDREDKKLDEECKEEND